MLSIALENCSRVSMTKDASDEMLLKAFRQGDDQAFYELFYRHEQALIGYVFGKGGDMALAKDICQETFMKLIHRPPRFFWGGNIKSWLFKVAANQLIDHIRRHAKLQGLDGADEQLESTQGTPSEALLSADDSRLARELLNDLPDKLRDVVSLHIFGGMTFREVAETLEVPLGTALWRMRKALDVMREKAREYDYE